MRNRRARWSIAGLMIAMSFALAASAFPVAAAPLPVGDVEYEVLIQAGQIQDPLGIDVAPDGRVIFSEREGELMVLPPGSNTPIVAGRIPVSANSCSGSNCVKVDTPTALEEGGLYAVRLAKDFAKTGRLYVVRPVPGSRGHVPHYPQMFGYWRVSTFVLSTHNKLDLKSEKIIFQWPVEWPHCCHYGGNLVWLPDGTLLLSTGDDNPASCAQYGGRTDVVPPDSKTYNYCDGELSVQNPQDFRGKTLRMMPDGSIPDGSQRGIRPNPFIGKKVHDPFIKLNPKYRDGTPSKGFKYMRDPGEFTARNKKLSGMDLPYLPYIYSLGYKQPFRGAIDPKTGNAYFDDVGPDAFSDSATQGPKGYEEINVIPFGGGVNHGWPRCMANNVPYHDYKYSTSTDYGLLSCAGMKGAALWYPHDVSPQWPQLLAGAVTSMPSLVYPDTAKGSLRLPSSYNNTLMVFEFSRSFMFTIPVNRDGTLDVSQQNVLVNPQIGGTVLLSPINAALGPDGAVYVLEYGTPEGYYNNTASRLGRIRCAACVLNVNDYKPSPKELFLVPPSKTSITKAIARSTPIGQRPAGTAAVTGRGGSSARSGTQAGVAEQRSVSTQERASTPSKGRLAMAIALGAAGILVLVGRRRGKLITV